MPRAKKATSPELLKEQVDGCVERIIQLPGNREVTVVSLDWKLEAA